ncbi:MAG: hypothetical protein F6K55_17900 [Moorea sp. SIO4A3]|nr:hypothetical protein [Moorena sp. SIO4A3]
MIFSLLPLASCLLPLAFPSWEGLGVGSSYLLPLTSYLLPLTSYLLPAPYKPKTLYLTEVQTALNAY